MRRARPTLALLTAFTLAASPAWAVPPVPGEIPAPGTDTAARADELKKQGDREIESLHFAEAAESYGKAYALAPTAALLYNRARALQGLGQFGEALTLFERFAAEAPPDVRERAHGFDKLLADVRVHVTTLSIKCNVDGALVRLYDRSLGTTPFQGPLRVNAGTATLEASAAGYLPVRRPLQLPGGGVTDLELHLDSQQESGVLALTSPVVGADVSVDGRPMGKVPLETVLRAGLHSIQVRHEGFVSLQTNTVVTAGVRKDIDIPLEKEASLASKWWFWSTIGVVVVGGAVTTVALLSTRSPDKGTIPPGMASTPLMKW